MARAVQRKKPTKIVEHDFVCHECGIDLAMLPGMRLVVHEPDCKTGEAAAQRREELRVRLDRAAAGGRVSRWNREDKARTDHPKGHQEIVIATGHHNPRNPNDWCYQIRCECGEIDIAWSYEDAVEQIRDHRSQYKRTRKPVY